MARHAPAVGGALLPHGVVPFVEGPLSSITSADLDRARETLRTTKFDRERQPELTIASVRRIFGDLATLIQSSTPEVQIAAVEYAAGLVAILRDPEALFVLEAASSSMRSLTAALSRAALDVNDKVAISALESLITINGSSDESVRAVSSVVESGRHALTLHGISSAERLGPEGRSLSGRWIEFVKSGSVEEAAAARATLIVLKPGPIAEVVDAFESGSPFVRITALWAIRGSLEPAALRMVSAGLNDPDASVRLTAAQICRDLGASVKEVVDRLIELARSSYDFSVQVAAIEALEKAGPLARRALPDLVNLVGSDEEDRVVRAALEAIGSIGEEWEGLSRRLISLASAENYLVRRSAMRAIAALDRSALDRYRATALDVRSDLARRLDAIAALAVGRRSECLVPLVELLNDTLDEVRAAAMHSIGRIGIFDSRVEVSLTRSKLEDISAENRRVAFEVLTSLQRSARQ